MELEEMSTETATPVTEGAEESQAKRYESKKRYEKTDKEFDKGDKESSPKKKFFKRKVCHFCKNKMDVLDYKDIKTLRRYVKDSGKIIPKRLTGTCSKHQRMVTNAIKRARNIALLPYETKY